MSVPSSKTMTTELSPGTESERIVAMPWTPLRRSASRGAVISCSTPSADSPSASVCTSTYGGLTSGSTSTGALRRPTTPAPTITAAVTRASHLNWMRTRTIDSTALTTPKAPVAQCRLPAAGHRS